MLIILVAFTNLFGLIFNWIFSFIESQIVCSIFFTVVESSVSFSIILLSTWFIINIYSSESVL